VVRGLAARGPRFRRGRGAAVALPLPCRRSGAGEGIQLSSEAQGPEATFGANGHRPQPGGASTPAGAGPTPATGPSPDAGRSPDAGTTADDTSADRAPLVDIDLALRTARLVAPFPRHEPDRVEALKRAVHDELPAIDVAARAFTGLGADLPPTSIRVVGRSAWVRTNVDVIAASFEPLRERLEQRPAASRRALGLQLGGLLGLLSTKVLGQFVLPLAGAGSGQLLLVGPNVLALAEEHGDLADDIRRTVVLHEVTHRLQFDGSGGWLGDHLRDLVARYLEHSRVDAHHLAELAPKLPAAISKAKQTGDLKPLLETVLTPEQAEVMDEAQGLMSLLEGHGNATMYSAEGAGIADPEGVREALASRQGDVASKVLTAVAGLEMKRRQYRDGEVFVRAVLERAGIDGLNRAFGDADSLPRGDEIADPEGWLARVGERGGEPEGQDP
jgi:coenzyme F420 biosynthesis associated uncharacterized protein